MTDAQSTARGAVVFAVTDETTARNLAEVLDLPFQPGDEGVRVMPFGASALAYSPPGSHLFRALVIVRPSGGPISPAVFDHWVNTAIAPYMAPQAPRIIL